jgi:hypothetical protein
VRLPVAKLRKLRKNSEAASPCPRQELAKRSSARRKGKSIVPRCFAFASRWPLEFA